MLRGKTRRNPLRQIEEQRYLWLFRAFCILFIVSVITNIVLISTYDKISPSAKREAFFVSSETGNIDALYVDRTKNDNFSISQNSTGYEIAKSYILSYIIDRESVFANPSTMQNLWGVNGFVYNFSSSDVYKDFINSNYYRSSIVNRDKKVISANISEQNLQYQPNTNVWIATVDIKTTNSDGTNPTFSSKEIKVSCDFTVGKDKIDLKNKWINPLGFKITSYEYLK